MPAGTRIRPKGGRMNWPLWIIIFVSLGAPVGILVADRALDLPARTLFKVWGLPSLVLFLGGSLYALATGDPIWTLVLWGFVGGILGTAALDIVRLIGVRFGAFPADMPMLFGVISLGLAPKLQRNMMAQMVAHLAELPEKQRRAMMAERLKALARLREPVRVAVVSAMQRGLAQLPEARRQAMMGTQMGLLAELPGADRRAVMLAMDKAMTDSATPVYAQPRGLPKIPMALFRTFVARALPQTLQEAGVSRGRVALRGYLWHFVIGSTFGITYTLLLGSGSWPLAFAWGIFVWAAMMAAMPPMMPMIRWPRWFPIVPFIAHIAMAVPIGYFALQFAGPAAGSSLVAAWGL